MKIKDYTYRFCALLVVLFAMASCQSDSEPGVDVPSEVGYTTVSVVIPEMESATSRAFADAPVLEKLRLHLVIFDDKGSFVKYLSQDNGDITVDRIEDGKVYYKVSLPFSTAPRVVHLIASEHDINYVPGREEISLPSLQLTGRQDAYWNRVALPNGIGVYNEQENKVGPGDEAKALSGVKLVRNFAKVAVDGTKIGANYDGFVLVGQPTHGTVIPYVTGATDGVRFADYNSIGGSYDELIKKFTGWEPTVKTVSKVTAAELEGDLGTAPVYLYERTYNVNNASFVVIKARYNNKDYYYHIDLVKLDSSSGQATGYHLLRNFEYKITIDKIDGEGYETLEKAIEGEASNNISYSSATKNLHAISDQNGDKIEVNFTQKVYVKSQVDTLKFNYTSDNVNVPVGELKAIIVDNDAKVLKESELKVVQAQSGNWQYYVIYNVNQMQYGKATFRVYRNGGLGREIEVISRSPWVFYTSASAAPGGDINGQSGLVFNPTLSSSKDIFASDNGSLPYGHVTSGYEKTQSKTAGLNVYVKIPKDMPRSTFPLVFKFESKNQLIYPNSLGVLTTHVENTGFDDWKQDRRIVYRYTLEYNDFEAKNNKAQNDVVIVAPFLFNADAVINTTTQNETDVIRVSNDYFAPVEITYTR